MIVAALILLGLVGFLAVRRRRRTRTLAGLNGDRPVFHVDPPRRRVGQRKHEAL